MYRMWNTGLLCVDVVKEGGEGVNVKIMCLASHHTTRCGCKRHTAHLEERFNTAARPPQSVPQTGTLEATEEWSGQQRAEGGLEGEGQPVPQKLIYLFPAI